MGRPKTPNTNEYPFHVTARSNNKDWFSLSMPDCWEIFVKLISDVNDQYGFITHGFVLMSNHYHWLLSTPNSNLGEGMGYFQTQTSWQIARESSRINHVYGGRYKFTEIRNSIYYANAYRYIFQNPLRASVTDNVFSYYFSSLNDSRIKSQNFESLIEHIPVGSEFCLWINELPPKDANLFISKALRRSVFSFPRNPKTKTKPSGLEFL